MTKKLNTMNPEYGYNGTEGGESGKITTFDNYMKDIRVGRIKPFICLESKEILKLSKSEINKILEYDYNKNLIFIIESDNYNPNKLDLYLKYINEYKNINYLKIFMNFQIIKKN